MIENTAVCGNPIRMLKMPENVTAATKTVLVFAKDYTAKDTL